jgi:hypothetical protein
MVPSTAPLQSLSLHWRYALLGGTLCAPFTLLTYWQTGSSLSPGWILCGGVLVGYLAARRHDIRRDVGLRVGVVGAVPVVLWMFADLAAFVVTLSQPAWFGVLQLLLVVGFLAVITGLSACCGELGGRIGRRLAT